MAVHVVRQGECIESIAHRCGLFWQTVWNHAKNAELKQLRKDHTLLAPGDEVFLPDIEVKEHELETNKRHTFYRKGVPTKLRVRFHDHKGEPRVEKFELIVDGEVRIGDLDDGWVDEFIMPDVRSATIRFPDADEEYDIDVGHLDPIDTVTGVQKRLQNLGFYFGKIDGKESGALEEAIVRLQLSKGLDPFGKLDDTTRDALEKTHGG